LVITSILALLTSIAFLEILWPKTIPRLTMSDIFSNLELSSFPCIFEELTLIDEDTGQMNLHR